MPTRLDSLRALVAAFVAVVASFVAASAISWHASRQIDLDTDEIQSNASPSIVKLTAARGDVRSAEVTLHELVEGRPRIGTDQLQTRMQRLATDLARYRALPLFPGELPYSQSVMAKVTAFRSAVEATQAGLIDPSSAHDLFIARVQPAADEAVEALAQDAEFNGRNLARLAAHIRQTRVHERSLSMVLELVAVVVAAIAAFLLRRVVHGAAELQATQARDAESRARELEQFAGRVAHDIRSPLTAVSTSIQSALRRLDDPQRARRALEVGYRGLSNANVLVGGLFDFARAGGKPDGSTTANLAETVRAAVASFESRARELSITLRAGALPEEVLECSPGVLTSVVGNLVGNALKYMGTSPRREVEVRASVVAEKVRIEVEDTGPGLAPGLQPESVFGMYVRGENTGQPGLGLGLATVKRLVEAHGGRCGVRSREGNGCVFWAELPRRVGKA